MSAHLSRLASAELNHRMYMLRQNMLTFGSSPADEAKLVRLQEASKIATRRELKTLVKLLQTKADIYHRTAGRLYSWEGTWRVTDDNQLRFVRLNGNQPTTVLTVDPSELTNGHGNPIAF